MINPAALIAAPIAATSVPLPSGPGIEPADLWRAGVDLPCSELSGLLEDCTGYTIDSEIDEDEGVVYFIVDPCGDRLQPDYPFPELASVLDVVGWRSDEALADCGLFSTDGPDDF